MTLPRLIMPTGEHALHRGNATTDNTRKSPPERLVNFPGVKALTTLISACVVNHGALVKTGRENRRSSSINRCILRRSRHHLAGRPGYLTENTAYAQQPRHRHRLSEVNLLPNMSVADNLFIGREFQTFRPLRRKEMEKRSTELMASYGSSTARTASTAFQVAMQQIVAICRAIDLRQKC